MNQFTFDGFGVNGCDEYKSRLATLTETGHQLKVGPLLAAAPELLESLKALERGIRLWMSEGVSDEVMTRAQAVIARAEGGKAVTPQPTNTLREAYQLLRFCHVEVMPDDDGRGNMELFLKIKAWLAKAEKEGVKP
jgi:hypothetical protein